MQDRLWYYLSVREQGQRQNTLNVYYNKNAGNPNAWTYEPDLSQPAYLRSHVGELHAAHHLAGRSQRNKFTGSWDEQPVCRKCTGTTSLTGSPNFVFPTSPEADGHGEFSPQRVQQVRWTSPVTNKLLLEAGFGTTYYQWGGKRARSESDREPGAGAEPHARPITPSLVTTDALPLADLVEQQDAAAQRGTRRRRTSPARTA